MRPMVLRRKRSRPHDEQPAREVGDAKAGEKGLAQPEKEIDPPKPRRKKRRWKPDILRILEP